MSLVNEDFISSHEVSVLIVMFKPDPEVNLYFQVSQSISVGLVAAAMTTKWPMCRTMLKLLELTWWEMKGITGVTSLYQFDEKSK